jgi:hypothetical protein
MSPRPEDLLDSIDSPQSFLAFVKALEDDARQDVPRRHAAGTRGWNSRAIEDFLEAMHAWATDSGSLTSVPAWRDVARLFLAGKGYE